MQDPLLHEILTLARTIGNHPAGLVLPDEGSIASRLGEDRLAVSRRGSVLSGMQGADFVHLDLQRFNELNAQENAPPEELAAAQLELGGGMEPHEDAPLFAWLLSIDPSMHLVAHIHPVAVDQITASPRARQFADRRTVHNEVLALGSASLLVNYTDPGLPLMREIQKKMILWRDRNKSVPRVILVQNHGAIVIAENVSGLLRTIDALLKYAGLFAGASLLGGPVFLTPQAITQIETRRSP